MVVGDRFHCNQSQKVSKVKAVFHFLTPLSPDKIITGLVIMMRFRRQQVFSSVVDALTSAAEVLVAVVGSCPTTSAWVWKKIMITSSNDNIFRVTGPLWRDTTDHRWIPPNKGMWRGALMFSLISAWTNGCTNNRDAGDLRRHRAHYDVTVM